MVERKRTKLQTMIYKTLLIALTITENNRDNTEWVIQKGQSRETGNIGYTRHKTKTNKAKHTTQYVLDTTMPN